jgi:hypothetical protein
MYGIYQCQETVVGFMVSSLVLNLPLFMFHKFLMHVEPVSSTLFLFVQNAVASHIFVPHIGVIKVAHLLPLRKL